MNKKSYRKYAIIFLMVQILVIIRNLGSNFFSFFWYCDFVSILFAVAFLIPNIQVVKGIINVGFFVQFSYMVVIFAKFLFGVTLFGFVFDFPFTVVYVLPTLIIHATTSIAFLLVYKEKPTYEALIYSFLLLIAIYSVVIFFSEPDGSLGRDYNFIFYSNTDMFSDFKYYTKLWIPLTFVIVVLPTHFFQYVVYRLQARWGN